MAEHRGLRAVDVLGAREHEVMVSLWADAPASVPTVLARLNGVRHEREHLAYTTVMTVLVRLHDKGLLARERRGRGFEYRPLFDERELVEHLSRREVDGLVRRFGPIAVAQFAEVLEEADPALLERLRREAAGD